MKKSAFVRVKRERETAMVRYELETESRSDVLKTDIYMIHEQLKSYCEHDTNYTFRRTQPAVFSLVVCSTTKFIFSLRQTIFSVFPPSMSVKA